MRRGLVTLAVAVGLLFAGQGAVAAQVGDTPSVGDTAETVTMQPTAADTLGESVSTPFMHHEPVRGPGGGDDDEDRSCTAPCPI